VQGRYGYIKRDTQDLDKSGRDGEKGTNQQVEGAACGKRSGRGSTTNI